MSPLWEIVCTLSVILLPGAVGGIVQLLLSLVQEMKEEEKTATFSDILTSHCSRWRWWVVAVAWQSFLS